MKILFQKRVIALIGGVGVISGFLLFLFYEAFFSGNFRTTQDKIFTTQQVNFSGLRELKASGGTSVNFSDLKRRLSHIKEDKIIVDAINEFHGYVKGVPTTFLAYQSKKPHWKYYIRRFVFTGTTNVRPDLVTPEKEEAKKNGFSYAHVKIGSKYISSPKTIDEVIKLLENLSKKNIWVHFHCHYGKGRTSMLLVMFDIIKNAPTVPLSDIIKRQYLLGSEDLLNTTVRRKGSYTKDQLSQRKGFITKFYNFICQRKAGGVKLWSEWLTQQKQAEIGVNDN